MHIVSESILREQPHLLSGIFTLQQGFSVQSIYEWYMHKMTNMYNTVDPVIVTVSTEGRRFYLISENSWSITLSLSVF